MLRITVSKNAKAAAKYFDEGLSKQDYYSEKNEIKGQWNGKLAEQLNLSGEVTKKDFQKVASNINPTNDNQLNVRDSPNRRAGYDFTFSTPKSVSLIYSLTKDKEILSAFNHAVQKSMLEVEKDMQTQNDRAKIKSTKLLVISPMPASPIFRLVQLMGFQTRICISIATFLIPPSTKIKIAIRLSKSER